MSNFRTVRVSKFRHVYGQPSRREQCYESIRVTSSAHDSQFCAVNPKFIAVVLEVAGGGAFQVLPLKWTGKISYYTGRVAGHNGVVNDLKWSPFNDNVIASCSDDSKVKLWYIPDGDLQPFVPQCLCELVGHARRVLYLEWHPTVEGVLASAAADCRICLWNVGRLECFLSIDYHDDLVYSISFSQDGCLLATTCKDGRLRLFDARTGQLQQESDLHLGAKSSKVTFLGDKRKILTTGFSKMSHRHMALWNQDDITSPLITQEIDTSAGVLFPFYDSDLNLLYLAGKGDGNIRYYEILTDFPHVAFLSEYQSKFPQRGLGSMPKRGLDVAKCEIYRFYKIHASQSLVEPLSFVVPRKSERFQNDLYPPTPGPTPTLTFKEWLCGIIKEPIRISLQVNFSTVTNKPVQVKMAFDEDDETYRPTVITSDRNNERKFQFLSEITKADYRDITQREDYPDLIKQQQLLINLSRSSKKSSSGHDVAFNGDVDVTKRRLSSYDLINGCAAAVDDDGGDSDADVTRRRDVVVASRRPTSDVFVTSTPAATLPSVVAADAKTNLAAAQCPCSHCSTITSSRMTSAPTTAAPNGDVCRRIRSRMTSAPASNGDACRRTRRRPSGDDDDGVACRKEPSSPTSSSASDGSSAALSVALTLSSASKSTESSNSLTAFVKEASTAPPFPTTTATKTPTAMAPPYLLPRPLSEKRMNTKPGCIGPGPLVHKEPMAHIVRPFRVSQSQPPTPRSSNLVVNSEQECAGKEGEIHKLYAEQCKRLRELMAEVEPKDKRMDQLERDLTSLTVKVEALQSELNVKQEDIESLRYEIAWKNKRITQLEQQLYKERH